MKTMLSISRLPVITSLLHVIETIAWLLIPEAANATAWGNCHSTEDEAGALNMRIIVPPAEANVAFLC